MSAHEYAQAGVDYGEIKFFKETMQAVGQRTLEFPKKRDVYVSSQGSYYYRGREIHAWYLTIEGLGNQNWIAEWMAQYAGTGRSYYEKIGWNTALMAVNDSIAKGAMPVAYTDEVAAGDSKWFANEQRTNDLAESFYQVCEHVGMALVQGESSSLRYLVKAEAPVKSAPSLSGCVVGIIAPCSRLIQRDLLVAGDRIIGVAASGLHANGISLVIKRAMTLKDKLLTKLPNGNTLGDEALIPVRSYVALVDALLSAEVEIHALVPGTGSGLSKIASDKRPFTYRIHSWLEVPMLFQYMRELGVSLFDCLTTFNWGAGYYIFVPKDQVGRTLLFGKAYGYDLREVGAVEDSERKVIFEPEKGIVLPPPGD
jgi:phosphoribosylformylglycinamidine cyclo-ligase